MHPQERLCPTRGPRIAIRYAQRGGRSAAESTMAVAITFEALPARLGDCLLIECHREGERPWRALIDGGPPDTWPTLRARLNRLPRADRRLDLVVVTHIDSDHIGGMLPFFESPPVEVGDVWFNGRE